jgi:hypothetical protein
MTKYQCPADVEAAMDRFAEDNPGAGWRAVIRGFQRAIKQSMRAGGDLYKNPHAMKREICGDCGVKEGQLHIPGCDMECCASCGGQSIWCECPSSTSTKERVPFILYPNLCAKCGTLWPEMFMVPDEEWERYIAPRMRGKMLCEACYTQIKEWVDGARQA